MAAPIAKASRIPATTANRCRPPASITTSTRRTPPGFAFRPTPACRPPTPTRSIRCSTPISPQPLYSFAAGYTHVFSQKLVNYFNPAFSWYESLFGPTDFQKTLAAFPIVLQGSGANAPFTTIGGLDNTWVQGRRAARFFINDNLAWTIGAHELRFGTNTRIFRLNDYDFGEGAVPAGHLHDAAAIHLRSCFHRVEDVSAREFAAVQLPEPGPLRAGHLEGDSKAHLDVWHARHAQFQSAESARRGGAASGFLRFDLSRCQSAAEPGDSHRPGKRFRVDAVAILQPRTAIAWQIAPKTVLRTGSVCSAIFCRAASSIWWASIRRTRRPFKAACWARWAERRSRREFRIAPSMRPSPPIKPSIPVLRRANSPAPRRCRIRTACLQPVAITAVPDGKLRAPYFMQWSFALERQIGTTINLRAQYVGTRAVNQPYTTQVNGYQTVCQGCFAPFPYGQPTDPRFGAVTQLTTGANSHYNGLQLTAEKRLGHGLQVQANYTWSHCMDTVSNGGFLPFSAGGILSPIPGDLARQSVRATTTSGTTSRPVCLSIAVKVRNRCSATR